LHFLISQREFDGMNAEGEDAGWRDEPAGSLYN